MTIAVDYLWVNKGCLLAPGETERLPLKNHKIKEKGRDKAKGTVIFSPGSFWGRRGDLIWPSRRLKQGQKTLLTRSTLSLGIQTKVRRCRMIFQNHQEYPKCQGVHA